MPIAPAGPYRRRYVRFAELWDVDGWRVKIYSLTRTSTPLPPELLDSGKRIAEAQLALATRDDPCNHGVAILTVHEGQHGDYVLIDWWSDNDILRHHNYGAPKGGEMAHQWPGPASCVWELAIIGFERAAWIEHVLSPVGPDLASYLAVQMNADV
jgi:hypothetical protein